MANVFGINLKKEQPFLSFWYEGEDTMFTQQMMPPVAIEGESELTKFKKKREENHEFNMYLTLHRGEAEGE